MSFRAIDNALTTLLGINANGAFRVVAYQRQSIGADEVFALPIVTVYYDAGSFPRSAGGKIQSRHDMTFKISVLTAGASKVDLRVLNDPTSSMQAIASALAGQVSAAKAADDLMDETLELIYQIIRDPRNYGLGLADGFVSNPWIGDFSKGESQRYGEYMVLDGSWTFTCSANEITVGVAPKVMAEGVDTSLEVAAATTATGYDSAQSGAEVQ